MTDKITEEIAKIEPWATQWVTKNGGKKLQFQRLEPLSGDGSTRNFFRLHTTSKSLIILSDPGWRFTKDYAAHQTFLSQNGLPVPDFLAVDPDKGLLIMEDLGDTHLQQILLEDEKAKMDWLIRAVDLLADLHGKTFPVPTSVPASTRYFDKEKYQQEMAYTLEHLGGHLLGSHKALNAAPLENFCAKIGSLGPNVFCHRDFHSRNLMVFENKIFLIDFQDARLGSPLYDLGSLVFDPYVPLERTQIVMLIQRYSKAIKLFPVSEKINWERFEVELKLVAFQRVLKAAGSFASFLSRFGKKTHVEYILPALHEANTLVQGLKGELKNIEDVFPLEEWIEKTEALRSRNWDIKK